MIKFSVLGSGSRGNATYFDVDGTRFLIDCGFTKPMTSKRLASIGRSVEDIQMVFFTHDHGDHRSPWVISEGLAVDDGEFFPFITSFPLSHDTDCVGYIVEDSDGNRVALITDTGCVPDEVVPLLFDCNAILIEMNYDVDMLAMGKYTVERLERVASSIGHLRNECAAELVEGVASDRLEYLVALHLSEAHNNPTMVQYCLDSLETGADVVISQQNHATPLMAIF